MVSDTKFVIPKIDSISNEFFQNINYEEAFFFLGFKPSGYGYERTYTNGKESIAISIAENGFQWIIILPGVSTERTIKAPKEFSIQDNLTPIEILAVLCREWIKIFKQSVIPKDLYIGHLYSEHIKNLKLSRPPKPLIIVERDYFRFIIKKIKKEQSILDPEEKLEISLTGEHLILCTNSKQYSIPVLHCENFTNEKISVSRNGFLQGTPARFQRETVSLSMFNDGLLVDNNRIKANWDGPNLWDHDEYDEFLSNRLIHRSIFFGG